MVRDIDLALQLVQLAFVLGVSIAVIVRMFRRGRIEDVENDVSVLPPSVRRWILGESRRRG
jgi:hypothetical protein